MINCSTIKLLIVDDSAVIRRILSTRLSKYPEIEVVATAADPYIAMDKIIALQPDVLTLDISMPRMDGITFLRQLMKHRPMPVIVLSSLTPKSSRMAIEALKAGALEVICKPSTFADAETVYAQLAETIKNISSINISNLIRTRPVPPTGRLTMSHSANRIIAIGASTGGVQALTHILSSFSVDSPGTLVVQHMPPQFTASFAERLNSECAVMVKEACDGETVSAGKVLIAPGGVHMTLEKKLNKYYVALKDTCPVHHHKPSVDVFFNSVAKVAADRAIGVILTGMGDDGAAGLLNMRRNGAHTIAQDEASCVVFGMPQEAIARGSAEKIVPLHEIANTISILTRLTK